MMLKRFLIGILITLNTGTFAISTQSAESWTGIRGSFFIIYFQDNDSRNAKKILTDLQTAYQRLSQEIEIQLEDSIAVYLTPSQKLFEQMGGSGIPKWSDGITTPSRNLIILKSARSMPPETDNTAIAIHELAHILLDRVTKGNPIPRWLNEGLAVYYSGEKAFASSSLVSKALLTNSIIALDDIDDVLNFRREKAQLAYQQSYLAVEYIIKNYGPDAIKNIVHKIGEGLDVDKAFLEEINSDVWDFEDEWVAYIKHKFRWHFLIEIDSYLWVIILLLFIVGFIIIRRRNKQTIARWKEEDEFTEPWTNTDSNIS